LDYKLSDNDTVVINLDDIDNAEDMYTLYAALKEAKADMEEAAANGKFNLSDSGVYEDTSKWLEKMSTSME